MCVFIPLACHVCVTHHPFAFFSHTVMSRYENHMHAESPGKKVKRFCLKKIIGKHIVDEWND